MKIRKKKARLEAIQRWWDAQPQNYKNATRRRSERTGKSHGVYASNQHNFRSDKHLLVLLFCPARMGIYTKSSR